MSGYKDDDHDQQFRHATDAAMRAISACHNLHGQYISGRHVELTPAAYSIRQNPSADDEMIARLGESDDEQALRGMADSIALYLKHHDEQAHQQHAPDKPNIRGIYDIMEQVRCEALGTRHLKGIRRNIMDSVEDYCHAKGYGDSARSIPVPREDALFTALRQQFFDMPASDERPAARSCSASSATWIAEKLGPEGIEQLKNNIHDPAVFAKLAARFATHLMTEEQPSDQDSDEEDSPPEENNQAEDIDSGEQDDSPQQTEEAQPTATQDQEQQEQTIGQEDIDSALESAEDDADNTADPLEEERHGAGSESPANPRYKIFTTQHDQIVQALDLVSREELHHLREKLDKQLEPLQAVVSKLANRLQRRLMAQQQRSWQFDVEEGMLDPARLARIVTNPGAPLSYKKEKDTDFKDTVVTLLIDNSGSMRGRPITIAALSTDILARTLERCGIKVEILGFTTSAWKGGFSREDWGKAGRPPAPGRLNDVLHIIYKPADSPWIRTRKNLGLMLKDGLLKENIDGEALRWAYSRIRRRPEHRKIMMVISDGAPVDDSTLSANHAQFLEHDLTRTIHDIERQKATELIAIGIGHDVTPYYKRAVTIKTAEELGSTMIDELVKLFSS